MIQKIENKIRFPSETNLKDSEVRYRRLFETAKDGDLAS
jgi:hypothetical protein